MDNTSPKLAPHTDFRDADLTQMNMSGIDLSYCDFSKSKIDGVDFSGSNLKGSKFEFAIYAIAHFKHRFLMKQIYRMLN